METVQNMVNTTLANVFEHIAELGLQLAVEKTTTVKAQWVMTSLD